MKIRVYTERKTLSIFRHVVQNLILNIFALVNIFTESDSVVFNRRILVVFCFVLLMLYVHGQQLRSNGYF